jgi:hypothetical protein
MHKIDDRGVFLFYLILGAEHQDESDVVVGIVTG